MLANSSTGGCDMVWDPVRKGIPLNEFHWDGLCTCCAKFLDFHFLTSTLCRRWIWKVETRRIPTSCVVFRFALSCCKCANGMNLRPFAVHVPVFKAVCNNAVSAILNVNGCIVEIDARSSVLYSVASPFSSKFGRNDFKHLPFWQAKTFETGNPKMQCTARWSFPMGKLLSHQPLSKMARESPMIKSICTRAPSKPRRQVQVSCWSTVSSRLASNETTGWHHLQRPLARCLRNIASKNPRSTHDDPVLLHKWSGSKLFAYGSGHKIFELQFHLKQGARAYHANTCSVSATLILLFHHVSSVACFAGGKNNRAMYKEHIRTLDIHFRKLPIHCGPSATYWLGTRMAWDLTRLERTSNAFRGHREDTPLVPNLLWQVLETGCSHCQPFHSSLDSKSLRWQPVGRRLAWAAKTLSGQQAGVALLLPKAGSMADTGHESVPLGSSI